MMTSKTIIAAFGAFAATANARLTGPCYVCEREDRFVSDRSITFPFEDLLNNRNTMSCGELEDQMFNDVIESNTVCGLGIQYAFKYCGCSGPPIVSSLEQYIENADCDICEPVGGGVPFQNEEEIVILTTQGYWPCGFLYTSAARGFLTADGCTEAQLEASGPCCTLPALDIPDAVVVTPTVAPEPTPSPTTSCRAMYDPCEEDSDCCTNNICRLRGLDPPKLCSAAVVRGSRQSLAHAGGYGGSASVSKGG